MSDTVLGASQLSVRERELRRACDELGRRLRAGESCRAEEILAANPALFADLDASLELLYTEFVVREQLGEGPEPEEWYARFPQWRRELEELFQVHSFVCQDEQGESSLVRSADSTLSEGGSPLTAHPGDDSRRQVAHYELGEEIGRGGMGVVYQARQVGLDRVVALKMILAGDYAGPDDLVRFQVEAAAAARLQHPNIVQIYEVGQYRGCPFLSFEYVDGGSLEEKLGDTPLPPRTAARLITTLARAVHYAHERGVVHRDLKPANVLLERSQRPDAIELGERYEPKISDFGLAKRLLDAPAGPRQAAQGELTQTGVILGTPSYMAPEQAAGKRGEVGPATDIYALGAILYRLLTGRPPFLGETPLDTLEQVRSREAVRPRQLRPKLPRDLETICLACLEKDPDRRFASAAALADDLCRFLASEPVHSRRVGVVGRSWRWCRRKPLVASLLLVLLAVCASGLTGVFWQWHRAEEQLRVTRQQRDTIDAERTKVQRERDRAETNYRSARQAVDRLAGLGDVIANFPGTDRAQLSILEDALAFYEELLQQEESHDPAMRFENGRAHHRAGDILMELGEWARAGEHYRLAGEIFTQLTREFPSHDQYRTYLAHSHHGAGHAAKFAGNAQAAVVSYELAIDLREEWLRDAPRDVRRMILLANAYMNRVSPLRATGREAEAKPTLVRALTLQYEALCGALDESPVALHADRLPPGPLERLRSVPPEEVSDQDMRQILDAVTAVVEDHPQSLTPLARWCLGELTLTVESLREVNRSRGNHEDALAYCRQALQIQRALVAQDPHSHSLTVYLARSYDSLASLLPPGSVSEQEDCYRQIISLLQVHVARFPDRYESRAQLVNAYTRLAMMRIAADQMDEAEQLLVSAFAHRDQLQANRLGDQNARRRYVEAYFGYAKLFGMIGRFEQAARAAERAAELAEAYVREHPEDAAGHAALGQAISAHTLLLLHQGHADQYRTRCDAVTREFGRLSHPELSNGLAWSCVLAPDALPDLSTVVQLAERAVQTADSAQRRRNALNTLGAALFRAGRYEEAIQALEQSRDAQGQGGVPQDWIFLAMAHARLQQPDDAGLWLEKAQKWVAEHDTPDAIRQGVPWSLRLQMRLFVKEAESLVAGAQSP